MPKSPTFTDTGQYVGDPITLADRAATAASGSTPWTAVNEASTMRLYLSNVSFTGGAAPTISCTVDTSPDATTSLGSLTAAAGGLASASAGQTKHGVYVGLDRYVRISWTTTGAPTNCTFRVTGEAL
jgi:hypothetical protein